jgi:glyceraldehyde 3-phosphate dehydrogenase
MANVAINGLGRIGRAALKIILETPELNLVAVNDLAPLDNLIYLLRYDSVYGRYQKQMEASGSDMVIDGKRIRVLEEKDPSQLPWKDMGVDIVFECTGHFTTKEGMQKHLDAGAKHVILSAPSKSEDVPTFIYGVNSLNPDAGPIKMLSCASCTTNSVTPVIEIVGRRLGIQKALMTTLHAYTASQSLVDSPNKKFRRGRAAGANFVPSTTGAATATTRSLPQYEGKFSATAVRAPLPIGSVSDVVMLTSKKTSVEEVNQIMIEEADSNRYKEALSVSWDQIVSSDIIQDPHGAIIDLTTTQVVDGDLIKVMSWYDNEWGYSCQMIRTARELARILTAAAA